MFLEAQRIFVAFRGERPAARLIARVHPGLLDAKGELIGMLGFFEALNDPEAVRCLFSEALAYLQSRGCIRFIGPINGDTWHSYRLNIGPWTEPPFLMEPYNAKYYPELWEQNGFLPLEDYYSTRILDVSALCAKLEPFYQRAVKNGCRFRRLETKRFGQELDVLYGLTKRIFAGNFLYTDISREDFGSLYEDAAPLLDSDLIWFAEQSDGEPLGFVFAFVDYFQAVRAMKGRTSLGSKCSFLWNKKKARTLNVKTLGVCPNTRGSGLAGALMYLAHKHGMQKGLPWANHCLIRSGNVSGKFAFDLGTPLRTYRLYEFHDGTQ